MAPPSKQGQFAQKVEQTMGLPSGIKLWSPFPFAGLNMQDTPPAIDDKEFSYIENYFHLGNGYMRAAYDIGVPIFTADARRIVYFFWYNIAGTDYVAIFRNNGQAIQLDPATGAQVNISTVLNLFYQQNGQLPICSQWGTKYLVIANRNTFNDYWIWDGATLFSSGGCGPEINITSGGANYSSLPTITAFGGAGSGIVITPTILNGAINTLVVTDPGQDYVPGDTVQLQFSGGGSDTGAILLAQVGSNSVSSVSIIAGGSGYSTPPVVTFSAPTGTSATATSEIGEFGQVTAVHITAPGSGYTDAPPVAFVGGSPTSPAQGYAVVQGGKIVQIVITESGIAYNSAPNVTIGSPTGGTTAIGTAVLDTGAVASVTITDPGAGYTSPPTVTFSGGGGTGASAVAYLAASGVTSVEVIDGGTNYTFPPPLSFVGGNGTGAAAVCKLVGTTVSAINVTSGGGTAGIGGYKTVPTVVVHNGGTNGSGCTATAVLGDGVVIGVVINNPGSGYEYPPYIEFTNGDLPTGAAKATAEALLTGTSIASVVMSNQGSGYTQQPAVVVQPGSNSAAAAILEMMPFGVSGSSMETFDGRVWLAYPFQNTTIPTGGDFIATAPGSLTDFATSSGGILYVNSDRFLRKNYTGIRQSNGYLYLFGDSSTSVVSNVNVSGTPPTTTFSYQNVDPQVGMTWRDSVQDFGRTIVVANETGIYGLYGGAMTKISSKLDQLFVDALFPPATRAITPSSAVATIFNVKHYFLLMTVTDPERGGFRNVLLTWNERDWTITSQSTDLIFIATQEVNGDLVAWGCDSLNIYPLFAVSSPTLEKRLTTKTYGTDSLIFLKDFIALYLQGQDLTVGNAGVTFTADFVASGMDIQPANLTNINNETVVSQEYTTSNFPDVLYQLPTLNAQAPFWSVFGTGTGGFTFNTMALRLSTTAKDFAISNLVIAYVDNTALF